MDSPDVLPDSPDALPGDSPEAGGVVAGAEDDSVDADVAGSAVDDSADAEDGEDDVTVDELPGDASPKAVVEA